MKNEMNFEQAIEVLKKIGSKTLFETSITLREYADLVETVCNEFGEEKVMNALNENN